MVKLVVVYGIHLCDHEDEALAPHPRRDVVASRDAGRLEEHFQRLSAAPFN